jgi:AcrR family transcriptional regulator
MRELKFPQSESKRRLLEAAEQLFAERGFEAVSVRDVTKLAKANVAAINYHFGSRDGLIALVVTLRITPVNEERMLRLDALEKKWPGKAMPLEEVIEAYARPLIAAARRGGLSEHLSCRLLGWIFSIPPESLPQAIEDQIRNLSTRFTRALAKSLPSTSAEDLAWRFHFVCGSMVHMLLHQETLHLLSNGASGNPTMEVLLGRFIRFAAAGLREGVEPDPVAKKGPQATFDF